MFDSILVLTDHSPRESMAVQRAHQLATAHRADVKLVDWPRGPSGALEGLAQAASASDLVVIHQREAPGLRSFFMGEPFMRAIRAVARPVLVVRRAPLGNYRRVLAAIDLDDGSGPLAQVAHMARAVQPNAHVELFHSVRTHHEAKLRQADVSEHSVRLYRQQCIEYAQRRMAFLKDSLRASGTPVSSVLGLGDPARMTALRQQNSQADLLVVGKRPASALREFFVGSVASRVLDWSTADVLVVPRPMRVARQALRPADPGSLFPTGRRS
jgi:nucleotide-binding universal stress UspA family protein